MVKDKNRIFFSMKENDLGVNPAIAVWRIAILMGIKSRISPSGHQVVRFGRGYRARGLI